MNVPILSVQHLSKRFKEHLVLRNISLDIFQGEIFGILGTNGSGKTTLLNTLVGYYQAQEGVLLYKGRPYNQHSDIKQKFGMATQDCSFYPTLTVLENIIHFSRLHEPRAAKSEHKRNALAILRVLNLYNQRNKLASQLSGGMQRRVDIACAMAHSPPILLLDEPTANLDPLLRKDMITLIKSLNKAGVTIIVASHFLSELEEVCHRVAVINKGVVKTIGTPDELLKESAVQSQLILTTVNKRYDLIMKTLERSYNRTIPHQIHNGRLIITSDHINHIHSTIVNLLPRLHEQLVSLDIKHSSLEDAFKHLIGDQP